MFFRQRATQAEYFDSAERTPAEIRDYYRWLGRVNRLTRFERPFRMWLPRLLGESECRELSILDLGAGEGLLGKNLGAWAAARGWQWQFTGLDVKPAAGQAHSGQRFVVGSVLALPFPDGAIDVVVATNMTHHLSTDAEVIRHFSEAQRVARRAILLCDLQRNLFFYSALGLLLFGWGAPKPFRNDGLLSIRRGWRLDEWRRLAAQAGLRDSRVWLEHGTRILLFARKPGRTERV